MNDKIVHMRDPGYGAATLREISGGTMNFEKRMRRPMCSLRWFFDEEITTRWKSVTCKKCHKWRKAK